MKAKGKQNRRRQNFLLSLRTLLVAVAILACVLAFYSREYHRQRQINASIMKLRDHGAIVYVVNDNQQSSNGSPMPITLWSVLTCSPTIATVVELSNATEVKELIPAMRIQIGGLSRRTGERHFWVDLLGNPDISAALVEEMKLGLPNCIFYRRTTIPDSMAHQLEAGMSQEQVVDLIGSFLYGQKTDWPGQKENTIRNLGTESKVPYTNAAGLETWTYFTDPDGIGNIGIDFTADRTVGSVWTDRGIKKHRGLTRVYPMIGGLSR
jgi:hypothetical protein